MKLLYPRGKFLQTGGLIFQKVARKTADASIWIIPRAVSVVRFLVIPRKNVVNLRPLDCRHLKSASDLCVRAKAHWGYDPVFMGLCIPGLQLKEADLEASDVVGAYDAEILVGVTQLVPDGGTFLLDKLFVEPSWIGSGIGRQLFAWCVEKVRQSGGKKIVIESDPFAEPIYLAFGCRKAGAVRSESTGRSIPLLEYHLLEQSL